MEYKTRSSKPIKSWFITYPQSKNISKEMFRDCFMKVDDIEFYCISEELHEDGNPHLHGVIQFRGKHTMNALRARAKQEFPGEDKRIDYQSLGSINKRDGFDKYFEKAISKIEAGTFTPRISKEEKKKQEFRKKCLQKAQDWQEVLDTQRVSLIDSKFIVERPPENWNDEYHQIGFQKMRKLWMQTQLLKEYNSIRLKMKMKKLKK